MRNWRAITLSGTLFKGMFTQGAISFLRCEKGLPEGAAFVRSYYNEPRDVVTLIWEHPTFPEVREGDIVSELDVQFRSYACPFIREEMERGDGCG